MKPFRVKIKKKLEDFQGTHSPLSMRKIEKGPNYTFSAVKVKSTTDTSGVGTRKAIPAAPKVRVEPVTRRCEKKIQRIKTDD